MEWQQILGLGAVTAVVTAFLNLLSTRHFANRQQKQSADFDALRLAAVLERFAYECASLIADEETWRDSRGSAGREFFALPSLTLPEDVAWKSLDIELVDRLFTLNNDLFRSGAIITGEREHIFEPDAKPIEPSAQAGLLGYHAHILALALRQCYQPIRRPHAIHPWDHVAILKSKHDAKIDEYRRYNEDWPSTEQ